MGHFAAEVERLDNEISEVEGDIARKHEILQALRRERRDAIARDRHRQAILTRAEKAREYRKTYLTGERRSGIDSQSMYVVIEPWICNEIQRFREVVTNGQLVLSQRAVVSTKTLREIENGKRKSITFDTADRIFSALDKPHLLGDVTIIDRSNNLYFNNEKQGKSE